MSAMEPHALADLIPPMSESEYVELRDDIAANGLHQPITLYEGKILDGRHRAKACAELGVEPVTTVYTQVDPVSFVIGQNVHRRHLTTAQKAEIARAALPHLREDAKTRQGAHAAVAERDEHGHVKPSSGLGSRSRVVAREQAGKLVGISGRTVAEMDHIARDAPDLHEQVVAGEKGVREAWNEVRRRRGQPVSTPTPTNGDKPLSNKARMNSDAARRRLDNVLAQIDGFALGLSDFDVGRCLQTAELEQVETWVESASRGISALRQLRKQLGGKA